MGYFENTTKRLTLANPAYWVDVATDLVWGELKNFGQLETGADGNPEFVGAADAFLLAVIKGWNLDDDSGQVLPVTPENIDRLHKPDVLLIIQEAGGLAESDDAKKNSISPSDPSSLAQT